MFSISYHNTEYFQRATMWWETFEEESGATDVNDHSRCALENTGVAI